MKKMKKAIAFVLTTAMIITSTCVPCLAKEKKADPYASLKKGTGYVAIGDSITRGFGASDHWEDQVDANSYYGNYYCRNVDGSYPNYVAKLMGFSAPKDIRKKTAQLWPITHNALSVAFVLDLLGIDDGFRDDEYLYSSSDLRRRYSTDLAYFGCRQSYNLDYDKDGTLGRYGKTGEIMSARKLLNNAGLITIALGLGDVPNKAVHTNLFEMNLEDVSQIPSQLSKLVKAIDSYYDYWKDAYPLLLDYIKEHNPDAKVVLVGLMNPFENVLVGDDVLLSFGAPFSSITDRMNKVIKQCAKKYRYIYVDINDVDTPSTDNRVTIADIVEMLGGGMDELMIQAHPTPTGYEQIARMIVKAVDEELAKDAAEKQGEEYQPEVPKTYIKLDIGKHESVDCVKIDGKKIKDYTVADHILTIPRCTKMSKTMTIGIVKADGSITVKTYALKYDNGYTARRIYLTNDLKGDIKTTINAPLNIAKKVINLIKGIIKR